MQLHNVVEPFKFEKILEGEQNIWNDNDVEFFENIGATNYAIAAEHSMAREHSLAPIFRELGERFHDIRLALNDTAERHMHLDQPSPLILP